MSIARSRRTRGLMVAALARVVVGCTPAPSRPASTDRPPAPLSPHIRFEPAGAGELAPLVRAFVARARAEGRAPLVYVGATWCEPCRYFHAAAARGALDAQLPALALLELDLDRDGQRIAAAGYASQMIPLFAAPAEDGRASGRQIEGSIHGPGSPQEIAPRLRALTALVAQSDAGTLSGSVGRPGVGSALAPR